MSLIGMLIALVMVSSVAQAANLGIPTPHTTLSGIGVVSGWKCDAGELTIRFNGGPPRPLSYGSERTDVLDAGACDSANVGFVSIMNWSNLGDGTHTAVVYDDGVEFDRNTFRVVTLGEAFTRHAAATVSVPDFPDPGETAVFTWTEATQHLELADAFGAPQQTPIPGCEGWPWSPLTGEGYRVHYDSVEWVQSCLDAGADPNARAGEHEWEGSAPLHYAARDGDAVVMRLLVAAGADPNARDSQGRTPLHVVLRYRDPHDFEMVVALLEAGANPNSRDGRGTPVLHLHYTGQADDMERVLIQYGADPNLRDGDGEAHGCSTFECLERKTYRQQ